MGHDITAFNKDTEVSYLRKSAWDPVSRMIYKELECEDLDGGVSGKNQDRYFSIAQLRNALNALDGKFFPDMVLPVSLQKAKAQMLEAARQVAKTRPGYDEDKFSMQMYEGAEDGNMDDECIFLNECVEYCEVHDITRLRIVFE